MSRSDPIRTCIGCGHKATRRELKRIAVGPEQVVFLDEGKAAHGRGAWVHPRTPCLQQAESPRALGRAFRRKVRVPAPGALVNEAPRES